MSQVMSLLMTAYPKQANELTDEQIALYLKYLEDAPFEAGKAAVYDIIGESIFFPRIAELRQAVIARIPGNQIPTSGEAWCEVIREMSKWPYGSREFSHPAIKQTVDTIGWRNLCTSENGVADRAHFMKIYDQYQSRAQKKIAQIPEARVLGLQLDSKANSLKKNNVLNLVESVAANKKMRA
jgi:hypothetical protein